MDFTFDFIKAYCYINFIDKYSNSYFNYSADNSKYECYLFNPPLINLNYLPSLSIETYLNLLASMYTNCTTAIY